VDWAAGRVRIRQNYVRGEFGTPKSKRSSRSVPLADRLAGDLERLFQSRYGEDATGHDLELVFAHPMTGKPIDRSKLLKRFKATVARAEVGQFEEVRRKNGTVERRPLTRFHDLRHTFGTRMAAAGVPMRTLQEWMGHRSVTTTMIYADYSPSEHEALFVERAFQKREPQISSTSRSAVKESEPV
jgi:integrase